MKLLFIRPNPPEETIGLQHVMIVEPLELEILATLVEKDHQVQILDMILEKDDIKSLIMNIKPDVVCVTGYITHTDEIINVCKVAKEFNQKIRTIVGGVYIEKVPESIDNEFVDFRVVRNATIAFPKLIKHIEENSDLPLGVLRKNERLNEEVLPPYDFSVPIPNRELTRKYRNKYFYVFHDRVALLKTSFGCPFPCSFCFCRKITGDNYFERELDEVVDELRSIEENEIYIIDDNFLVSEKRVINFMKLLEKYKIKKKYLIYGRAEFIANHPGLIREFKKYGLRTVIVGFESFNDSELKSLNKKTLAKTNELAMKVLNENGVDCYASVIAMPSWSEEDFKTATKKMIELKIRFVNIQPLTPLEKTDISIPDDQLLIDRSEYAKWDLAHVIIRPEKISLKSYYNEIIKMYKNILFRPGNLISHLKHPIRMQLKLLFGALKVKKQYQKKIKDA